MDYGLWTTDYGRCSKEMDTIANFLTSIRNASAKEKERVDVPYSKLKREIARVLKEEGYIIGYKIMEENNLPLLRVQLKYTEDHKPLICGIKRVSKPGLRIYHRAKAPIHLRTGIGIAVISTPKGVMTNRRARQSNVGGELLCYVW